MPPVDEPVMVWTGEAGQPERLVWRSRRFRVTDTPTALVGTCEWWRPFAQHDYGIGHPPLTIAGWRFQATADNGETHVFDVRSVDYLPDEPAGEPAGEDRRWQLVRIFD